MLAGAAWMHAPGLLFVLFLVFFFVFFILGLFVIFVVEVVGYGVQMDGMRLRDFQFGFTFRTAQDFALFHFVFVHINFGATIGAANHGTILRAEFTGRALENRDPPPTVVLYTAEEKNKVFVKTASAHRETMESRRK